MTKYSKLYIFSTISPDYTIIDDYNLNDYFMTISKAILECIKATQEVIFSTNYTLDYYREHFYNLSCSLNNQINSKNGKSVENCLLTILSTFYFDLSEAFEGYILCQI